MKKISKVVTIYWGDFVFYLSLPLFLLFSFQAMKTLPNPTPESFGKAINLFFDQRLAIFLFFFYLVYALISLIRVAAFRNTKLRHWSYLFIGIFAMLCFIKYAFPSEPADIFIARMDQDYFKSVLQLMQSMISGFLIARMSIWLYKMREKRRNSINTST